MAEQSSTVAAFRALVMLLCLILIPVAAFCGSSFPAVLKAIENGRWPTLADFRGPAGSPPPPSTSLTEAPRFSPQTTGTPLSGERKGGSLSDPAGSSGSVSGDPTRGVIRASYDAPAAGPAGPSTPSTSFPQSTDPFAVRGGGLSAAGNGGLPPMQQPPAADNSGRPALLAVDSGNPSRDNQLNLVLKRLQELGVTYFVLEPCGDRSESFRFFCQMSVGGNRSITRPFWSFDSDPLRAMTQVLKQVEAWQTGGS
jgi:hypothetical protein